MNNNQTVNVRRTQLSESDAAELILDSYVMQRKTQVCANCTNGEMFSTIYEVWVHPFKTRLSGYRQLRRPNGPMNRKLDMRCVDVPDTTIPFCSDCGDQYTFVLDDTVMQAFPPISESAWAETLKRKYAPETKTPTEKITPTVDML